MILGYFFVFCFLHFHAQKENAVIREDSGISLKVLIKQIKQKKQNDYKQSQNMLFHKRMYHG